MSHYEETAPVRVWADRKPGLTFPYPTVLDQMIAIRAESKTSWEKATTLPYPTFQARHDYTILELRNGVWYKWYMQNQKAGVDHLGTSDRAVPVRVERVQACRHCGGTVWETTYQGMATRAALTSVSRVGRVSFNEDRTREVAHAIDLYLAARSVHVSGPRTIHILAPDPEHPGWVPAAQVYIDPSGKFHANYEDPIIKED